MPQPLGSPSPRRGRGWRLSLLRRRVRGTICNLSRDSGQAMRWAESLRPFERRLQIPPQAQPCLHSSFIRRSARVFHWTPAMFVIRQYTFQKNDEEHPASGLLREKYATREEAKARLEQYLARFDDSGYEDQHGYWWARSEKDAYKHRRFVIEGRSGSAVPGRRAANRTT